MDPFTGLVVLHWILGDSSKAKRTPERSPEDYAALRQEREAQEQRDRTRRIADLKEENREKDREYAHRKGSPIPDVSKIATYSRDRTQQQRSSTNAAETMLINLFEDKDIPSLLSKYGDETVWSRGIVKAEAKRGSIPKLLSSISGNALERRSVIEFPIASLLHDLFTELSKRDTWFVPRLLGLPQDRETVEKVLSLPKLAGGSEQGLNSIMIPTTSKGKLNSMTSHNFTVKELVGHLMNAYWGVVENTALSDSAKADARNAYKDLKFQRL